MNINKKLNYKTFFLGFLLFQFFTCPISASDSDYYADITIDVDSSGFVTIEGITDYPDLLTQNSESYTSKDQSYWMLNITIDNTFDFVYDLTLPKNSEINFIKSTGQIRIQDENGRLKINGYGLNESLSIVVQYSIKRFDTSDNAQNNLSIIFIASGIIGLIIVLFVSVSNIKGSNKGLFSKDDTIVNYKGLSERQREIMELLVKENRSMTQTEIQKKLNMPKSAVSRHIISLELKDLIEKESIGMSNLIRLKKQE